VNESGGPLKDDTYLICLNPHHEHIEFYLPACTKACGWEVLVDTRDAAPEQRRF
jgi:isoamylase